MFFEIKSKVCKINMVFLVFFEYWNTKVRLVLRSCLTRVLLSKAEESPNFFDASHSSGNRGKQALSWICP